MTDLVIRKIPWEFDSGIPFMWQPNNPNFAIFCNAFTFIAVPFEKYIISALRRAQVRLGEDEAVAAEAEAFLRQEAQHAAAHRKHMLALIERYPGLEQTYRDTLASYDALIEDHPVEFHAAYVANLEATFTPLFKVILDNRNSLFAGGDGRVGSLMAWHFVEEIEHRSSGLILYRHLCPDPWYRTKLIRSTFKHVGDIATNIARSFDEHVPFEDRGTSAEALMSNELLFSEFKFLGPGGKRRRDRRSGPPTLFHAVPTSHLVKMVWRLALSQTPNHDPAVQPLPEWADTWMREYDRGADMTTFVETTSTSQEEK
ncbi:putative metal-dependent hydrolase [Mycobacteroides abscessus subsp. bolletii]|uniref:metal-dependent hydrolase n=1 Tax=Mycobacteroides abscessus TaxID=36809 RepID=UPI0009A5B6F6|nr:metal-dependent hydrolase [Mycobacteroides abscessus]SLD07294.1 putative metal-dependent hydrolase [Mycobacteroides abscessus subsp. bolletii]